jgi:hypothetical protein
MYHIGFEARLALSRRGRNECWPWQGARTRAGYGVFRRNKRNEYAHRAVYELLVGPIPEGAELDHTCPDRACCNPAHLGPVSHAENMRRYGERTANCRRGHPVTGANINTKGGCRECDRLAMNAWRRKQGVPERRRRKSLQSNEFS